MSSAAASQIPLEKTIVLSVPAKGMDDEAGLRASLVTSGRGVRVLLCIREGVDQSLAASVATSLAAIGIETQILLHAQAQGWAPALSSSFAPLMPAANCIEFALALSSFASKSMLPTTAGAMCTQFRTRSRAVGHACPSPEPQHHQRTDPAQPGWLADRRSMFGRLEQAVLEAFAFGWSGWSKEGRAESAKRLKQCFQQGWTVEPYFAPDEWRQVAPDLATLEASPFVRQFDAMDRSALFGSYIHRDLIWVTYFGAAFAVLAAVAGHSRKSGPGGACCAERSNSWPCSLCSA